VYEATLRIIEGSEVKGDIMFIVACLGLVFNLIQMKILHSGDGHYHLGGSHDHHDHSHDHGHKHENHKHKHKHGKKAKKVSKFETALNEGLIDREA
jgi:solute carrier family 30 (zinc transporter), member 2